MILNKDDTCFQIQFDLCICTESVIVQLHFHQLWSLCDLWFKRYLAKYVKVQKICYRTLSLYHCIHFILVSNCSHFQEISNGLFDKGIARYHCIMVDMTPLWVSYIKSLTASYVTVMTNLVEQFLFTTKVSHQSYGCKLFAGHLLINC